MKINSNKKFYVWIIIILIVLNLSTVLSVFMHNYYAKRIMDRPPFERMMPPPRPVDFFKNRNIMNDEQFAVHRKLRRSFHLKAREISEQLQDVRIKIIDELALENPDTVKLNLLAERIGKLHTQLKLATINFYLNTKKVCTPEQQMELKEYYKHMINGDNPHFRNFRNKKIRK